MLEIECGGNSDLDSYYKLILKFMVIDIEIEIEIEIRIVILIDI